jgi:hypothetical protein
MNEISVLKKFLSFPISSTKEIFDEFKTIDGHIFREKNTGGKERFLYVEGKLKNKALLVAHADTVFDTCWGYHSKKHEVIEDSNFLRAIDENGEPQLLGADDRAGIAMLWLLKDSGHSLLVTDGEEHGQIGSNWIMNRNKDIADRINRNHQFMIQLDRRNGNDFKCYDVGTKGFRNFIAEQTGYSEPNRLAGTDIRTLCRNICGVNFSVGYHNEHSKNETLIIQEWIDTLNVVRKILLIEPLPEFHLKFRYFRVIKRTFNRIRRVL